MTAAAVAHEEECPTSPSTPSKSFERTAIATFTSGNRGNANGINKATIGSILSTKIDALPRSYQFVSLALCVFFFFGIHNVLQETMINTEGFTFGVMLGWMEVLGVTLCSGLERSALPYIGNGEGRRHRMAPWQAYPPLTICLLMSSSLASWSLNYINFPTKVVFRSCKLLPTMILAYVMGNAKTFTYVEVGSAVAVCAGLITFAAGDWHLSKPQFHPFGLTLVSFSVFADAVLPNAQERLFRTYDASKSEVMFFTNIYTLVVQTVSTFLSGDLMGMFHFVIGKSARREVNYFSEIMGNSTNFDQNFLSETEKETPTPSGEIRHTFLLYMMAYILISHIAVSAHTAIVKKFGGVAAVFVGTARKGMTLILSFVLFPKEFNWRYPFGAILVLGGLAVASLEKQRYKHNKYSIERKTSTETSHDEKLLALRVPLSDSPGQSDGITIANGDSERQPLINLDVELGGSSSAITNRPERRR
ncbi:hypothetical protein ACHAWF_018016 [Thalassiosira exigua]